MAASREIDFVWLAMLPPKAGQLFSGNCGESLAVVDKIIRKMAFPIKVCMVCSEEFELKPGKPGFANRCPACSEPEADASAEKKGMSADERKSLAEANEARRKAMRDLLYRRDS